MTFNYDCSLEANLRKSLRHIQIFSEMHVEEVLRNNRIVHIYGNIRNVPLGAVKWEVQYTDPKSMGSHGGYHLDFATLIDKVFDASVALRVIDPHDKATNEKQIEAAKDHMANARRMFILDTALTRTTITGLVSPLP